MARNKKPLNLDYILNGVKRAIECAKDSRGKEVVLTFGLTGFGKSTLIAYLQGSALIAKEDGTLKLADPSEDDPVIGHGADSETVFARAYSMRDSTGAELTVCDMAGFSDTRSVETVVVTLASMEMVVRNAAGIKAFLLVVPWRAIDDERGLLLREMVKSLVLVFKDPVEMARHAVLVVNRCREPAPDAKRLLKARLEGLVKSWKKRADDHSLSSVDDLDLEHYSRMAAFCTVLSESEKLVFLDPFDGGISRRAIFSLINGVSPKKWYANVSDACTRQIKSRLGYNDEKITIADFTFDECNKHRQNANLAVYAKVDQGMSIIRDVQAAAARFLEIGSDIPRCQTQITAWQKLLDNLRQNPDREKQSSADDIKELKSVLKKTEKSIQSKKSELAAEEEKRQGLAQKLSQVDVDTPEFFGKAGMFDYVFCLFFLGYRVKDFCLDTGDRSVPFVDIVAAKTEKGNFVNVVDERQVGRYSGTYKSEYHARPAYFEVKAYIRKRDEAGNKKLIANLRQDISASEERARVLGQEIAELERERDSFESSIRRQELNEKCDEERMRERLRECEENVASNEARIAQLLAEKEEVRGEGLEALRAFRDFRPALEVVVELSDLLEFPSDLVKMFASSYREFVGHVSQFEDDFEVNACESLVSASGFFASNSGAGAELRDPISGEPIRHPVVSPAGTLFEADSLIRQFNVNDPSADFVFQREDGRTETISFMSWKNVPSVEALLQESRSSKAVVKASGSSSSEELERQREEVEREIRALEQEILVKRSLLERISFELLRKARESR